MKGWEWSVGSGPSKVTAYERTDKKSVVYLRWLVNRQWVKESLGECCRTTSGRLIKAVCDRAMDEARRKHNTLKLEDPEVPSVLTLADTDRVVLHPSKGRWSEKTQHGREVKRAVAMAVSHWGGDLRWARLSRADWRSLWRWRLASLRSSGHRGHRGAELLVQRLMAVADWLVEEGHVLRIQKPEAAWRDRLVEDYRNEAGEDPEPRRPRHTLEEMRAILRASEQGDPRFALLLALGAEVRLGQVARCTRRDLDLDAGTLRVRGRGKKGGAIVSFTPGQLAAVQAAMHGYLHRLELALHTDSVTPRKQEVASLQLQDYPLFPQGQMPGGRKGQGVATVERHANARPVNRRWILHQFRLAETRAGVPHVPGRGAYGVKRAAVDAVKALRISREGLKAHGGWSSTQIPDRIYADMEADYAREEAARLRIVYRDEERIPPAYPAA